MKDTLSTYHPAVNFVYFLLVLLFAMLFMHPICLGISLLSAFSYMLNLKGKRALDFNFKYMLPMLIVTALVNPAFNHAGATILAYLPSGNPLTLESFVYGIAAAAMLAAVLCWFSCYNIVMTSDKFMYLFGKVIPALSMILSMTLRFIPRFKEQLTVVTNAQRCMGRDVSGGGILQRAKHGITILSIMVTWALENSIDTANSMKSRGYGLPGRTVFSVYRFDRRDRYAMLFLIISGVYIMTGFVMGELEFQYFPGMNGVKVQPFTVSLYACYMLLCTAPIIINIKEDWKWKAIQSKI